MLLLMVAVPAGIGIRFAEDPAVVAWWWAGAHTVPLIVTDVQQHRLPRWWLFSMVGGGLVFFASTAVMDCEPSPLLRAVLAGIAMWLMLRLAEWLCGGRMGGGDTRLHAVLAFYTGWMSWHTVVIGFLGGSVLLGLTAGIALVWRRRTWSSRIAAAPSLLAGSWIALLLAGS